MDAGTAAILSVLPSTLDSALFGSPSVLPRDVCASRREIILDYEGTEHIKRQAGYTGDNDSVARCVAVLDRGAGGIRKSITLELASTPAQQQS